MYLNATAVPSSSIQSPLCYSSISADIISPTGLKSNSTAANIAIPSTSIRPRLSPSITMRRQIHQRASVSATSSSISPFGIEKSVRRHSHTNRKSNRSGSDGSLSHLLLIGRSLRRSFNDLFLAIAAVDV